jgi:IS30 family transposase
MGPPRHLSMRDFTQADFDTIAAELNDRPRQTLDYQTPSQALVKALR